MNDPVLTETLTKLRSTCVNKLNRITSNLVDEGSSEMKKTRMANYSGQHLAVTSVIKTIDGMLQAIQMERLSEYMLDLK